MKYEFNFPSSTMLASCSYNSEENELSVTFTNGKEYTFVMVDKATYIDLINAESPGRHFNAIKKGLVQKV